MNCPEARQHLAMHADGELRGELGQEVQRHVAHCDGCRAETARWQALRHCTRRVLATVVVPATLQSKIVAALHAPAGGAGAHRLLRWGGAALALAAAILLTIAFWPFGSETTPSNAGSNAGETRVAGIQVQADTFTFIHNYCVIDHTHDAFQCGGKEPQAICARLDEKMGFHVLMPDLSKQGYVLAGACWCLPSREVRGVHAFYRKSDMTPKADAISFFSLNKKVALQDCPAVHYATHASRRPYETASVKDLNLVKWDSNTHSYAICGNLPREELLKLADAVDIAQRTWEHLCMAALFHP